jgi:glycosyltransferase involved in cell wall biosynthesis
VTQTAAHPDPRAETQSAPDRPLISILMLSARIGSGGLADYTRDLAIALVEQGHQVTLHTTDSDGVRGIREDLLNGGVPVMLTEEITAQSLKAAIAEARPNAIKLLSGSFPPDTRVAKLLLKSDLPIVESIHAVPRRLKIGFGRRMFYRARPKDRYRAVGFSPEMVDLFSEFVPSLASNFLYIDAGMRLPRAIPSDLDRRCPDPDWARFVTATRLSETHKDTTTLIHAFAMLGQRLPNATLQILGDGPDRQKLERIAHDCGVANRVQFSGWVDDPVPSLRVADAFVLATKSEGFGRVNVAAAALGLPVIASDVGGCKASVANGVNGLLVKPQDATALANAMLQVIANPERYRSLSAAGPDHARRFAIETHAAALVDIMTALPAKP